jgi:hypothetical protein
MRTILLTLLFIPFIGFGQCKLNTEKDVFSGAVTVSTPFNANQIAFIKVTDSSGNTTYSIGVFASANSPNYTLKGIKILLADSSALAFDCDIDCSYSAIMNRYYYGGFAPINADDIKEINASAPVLIRLGIYDWKVKKSAGIRYSKFAGCIIQ